MSNSYATKKLFSNSLGLKRCLVSIIIATIYIVLSQIPLPFVNLNVIQQVMHDNNFKMLQIISSLSGW